MPYVMVPVPEEHVEEVMSFVLRTVNRASMVPWDPESITRLFEEVDELSRALLSFVARATLAGKQPSHLDAAKQVQLSGRETVAIMREINELGRADDHPIVISQRTVPEALPNGRSVDTQVFHMEEDVAELVREAERAELRAEGLGSTAEPG